MKDFFAEPWDPDAPLRERLIARMPALGVLAGMIMIWARLMTLWTSGTIQTTPFFGSTRWNLAMAVPTFGIIAAWWIILERRERNRAARLAALMPLEPLAGWHRRIRALDDRLTGPGPRRAAEVKAWQLTLEVVNAWPGLDATQRGHVRQLWLEHENFRYYASLKDPREREEAAAMTAESVRRWLILHAIRDNLSDPRDEAVALSELQTQALAAGIDFASLEAEVARL